MVMKRFSDFIYSFLYIIFTCVGVYWCRVWECVTYRLCFPCVMSHLFKEGKLQASLWNSLLGDCSWNYGWIICSFYFRLGNVQWLTCCWFILIKYLLEKWFLLLFCLWSDEIKAYTLAVFIHTIKICLVFICIIFYVMLPSCGHLVEF